PFSLADQVAPNNRMIGLMLPCTPMQVLLMSKGLDALVMTSANLSDEPIAVGNREALKRLCGIADFFLIANRDIHIRADDSVMQVVNRIPRFIRRSRGYVPLPVFLSNSVPPLLAVGGELKNTLCLTRGDAAFLSQHIGDLENLETLEYFHECRRHLMQVLQIDPQAVACDLHPDYLSTQWADEQKDLPVVKVQHHHAHIASCLAENGRNETVIGLAMDGTGYGEDGHIWGGEILLADQNGYRRVGRLQETPMPGGSVAVQQPWRMTAAYLWEAWREDHENGELPEFLRSHRDLPLFDHTEKKKMTAVLRLLETGIQTIPTSSLGRWFDGMAALTGIRPVSAFEGQAAMELEMAMPRNGLFIDESGYTIPIEENEKIWVLRLNTMIREVCRDIRRGVSPALMSLRFHLGLIDALGRACRLIRDETGINTAALSGGCFQNRFLSARLESELKKHGFDCLTHSQVPANDGGLSLGQAVVAANQLIH
ncbi:MAG TPA: carbamoyltransferase HypF, partial [bacterium]|nr:carbamoyltransferase HypF [bacterium]